MTWFLGLLILAVCCLLAGIRMARWGWAAAIVALVVAALAVFSIAWLRFNPGLVYRYVPLDLVVWLEGVIAVFPWMLMVGVLWAAPAAASLRRSAPLLFVLGLVYFTFGAVWMVLPDIDPGSRDSVTPENVILQSRPDSCAAAAAGTALRRLGFRVSESEMCRVVLAKPTRGSTLARTAWGLGNYLDGSGIDVQLEPLNAREIADTARTDRPILAIIRSGYLVDHMVVVLGRDEAGHIVVANPSPGEHGGVIPISSRLIDGIDYYNEEDFRRLVRPGGIVISDLRPMRTARP